MSMALLAQLDKNTGMEDAIVQPLKHDPHRTAGAAAKMARHQLDEVGKSYEAILPRRERALFASTTTKFGPRTHHHRRRASTRRRRRHSQRRHLASCVRAARHICVGVPAGAESTTARSRKRHFDDFRPKALKKTRSNQVAASTAALPVGCACSSKIHTMAQEMGERLMMVQVPSNKSTIPAATAKANVPHLSNKSCKHWKAAATAKEKDQAFAPRFTFHWCYVEDVCHARMGGTGRWQFRPSTRRA